MSRVEDLWDRLVRAAIRGRVTGGDFHRRPEAGLAANVPSSLGNKDIDDILRAADEIQDVDPNISRILCEHAYSLAQNLDPNSEGRGVLQFKTGLMSVIKILDEAAVQSVFLKSLDNYIKWCTYLRILPVWSNLEAVNKEKKLLFISLYFLLWGEAANIRFLPECLCYIFHHMGKELEELLRQQVAQPANSCLSDAGVSFLDQVIRPLYEVITAEAAKNDNGMAPHSAWRNYDDFNEFFWSLSCFDLCWPWNKISKFFQKPTLRSKVSIQLYAKEM